jgi:threonine dehydrogenase-like Zn-dependent dehydrogenase
MAQTMQSADLELVPDGTPGSQSVAVLEQPFRIVLRRARIPEPAADEVRIRVVYVGICGSDLESYRGIRSPEFMTTPARLGHEVSGVIDAVGSRVRGLKMGQRVASRYVWGAFAEYIACKAFNVHPVPSELDDTEISPIEVLPGILHAAERAEITTNTDVLIMGQGVSGLVMTQVVSLFSPRSLVVTDRKECNLEFARRYGATHAYRLGPDQFRTMDVCGINHPNGFEVVIPCLLEGNGVADALDACAFGGRIVLYGCIAPTNSFDWLKLHRKRADILSTEPKRDIDMRRWFSEGVNLVQQGLVNVREMITQVYPLSQIEEAFRIRDAGGEGTIHVLVDCRS